MDVTGCVCSAYQTADEEAMTCTQFIMRRHWTWCLRASADTSVKGFLVFGLCQMLAGDGCLVDNIIGAGRTILVGVW